MSYVDLHTHSTASDGSDSPAKLVENAKKAGLAAVALTDHDTMDGLAEAREAARDLDIELIGGCEISTSTEMGSMHILGLWVPEDSETLKNFLAHMRAKREERNEKMLEKLRANGFEISAHELRGKAKGVEGRPHMAAVLVEKGYVKDVDEAFAKYLGIDGCAYVPKVAPRPEQAVRLLADVGATVALAHPFLRKVPEEWIEGLVGMLAGNGLDALEAWHSSHSMETTQKVQAMARRHGLGISGGSDYHGKPKPGIKIGEVGPGMYIPGTVLDNLKDMRKEKGLPC